jgi:hypothetical protein
MRLNAILAKMWPLGWDRIAMLHPALMACSTLSMSLFSCTLSRTTTELKVLLREVPDDIREEIRILETGHVKTSQRLDLPCFLHKYLQVYKFSLFSCSFSFKSQIIFLDEYETEHFS